MRFVPVMVALILVPVSGFAQELGATATPETPWYATTTGIAGATALLVSVLKRLAGNAIALKDVPTWLYAVLVGIVLTLVAHYGFGALQGQLSALLMNAAISSAAASGFYEWLSHPTKTLEESAATRLIQS